jgi:hypothetical protein
MPKQRYIMLVESFYSVANAVSNDSKIRVTRSRDIQQNVKRCLLLNKRFIMVAQVPRIDANVVANDCSIRMTMSRES